MEPFPVITSATKPPEYLRVLVLECRSLAPIVDPRLSVEYDAAASPEKIAVLGPGFMRLAEGPVEEIKEMLAAAAGKVLKEAQADLHRKLRVPKRIGLLSGVASPRSLVGRFLEVMATRWSSAPRL